MALFQAEGVSQGAGAAWFFLRSCSTFGFCVFREFQITGRREQWQVLHTSSKPKGTGCLPVRPQSPVLHDGAANRPAADDAVAVRSSCRALAAPGCIREGAHTQKHTGAHPRDCLFSILNICDTSCRSMPLWSCWLWSWWHLSYAWSSAG